jgi:hypothetical protein
MSLKPIVEPAQYGLLIWLAVLAAALLHKGLAGGDLRGLIVSPRTGEVSAARLQALGVVVGFVGWYGTLGLQAISAHAKALPELPPEALSILAASLGVHIGGKVYERRAGPTRGPTDPDKRIKAKRKRP